MSEKSEKIKTENKKISVGRWQMMVRHIRRSPLQSLAAVLVMILNFFLATCLVVLVFAFTSLLSYFETRPEVTAFLNDKADVVQIEALQKELNSTEGVKETRFVSKEEALEIYRDQNKNNPLLLEMVSASILPASIEISAVSPDYLGQVAEKLKGKTAVIEEVVFQKDMVEKLTFWVNTIRTIGIGFVSLLSFIAIVMVVTIIGMKIASSKDEITALRSLGATDFYIQSPFLLEGIFYGVTGFLVSWLTVFGAVFYFRGVINAFFQPVSVLPDKPVMVLLIFILGLLASFLFGLLSSWIATKRYLKR